MMEQLLNLFVSTAYADTTGTIPANPQGGSISFVLMFAVLIFFIYFAVWRPQNKRAKEQQNLLSSIAKGDEVMTAGGMLGRITKMADQYITLNIANNVEIIMQKSSVVSVLPKGTLKSLE